jgi:hypothetical protein
MRAIATQSHLAQDSVLAWRQHNRTPPHHRVTFGSPVGHWVWVWILGVPGGQ